ncbi:hypothetical protein LWC34_08565 [Kibdelosporangium philippinense]|uniref:CpXC domain-containing protein n=1 Tax=Kibdelosporangium philippinense TaxID=211113 RepID=A0ABS8Z8J3_9PSEU|nr:hypothetical protein [Kibdelosporangium philippinense]MCE7002883.1 hypothetical protein [Kibdelosporangium philippinense]
MEFGCAQCYGEDAETVMEYCTKNLETTQRIVSDSHFGVSVRKCPECGQEFIAIFTEFVDWQGGDDAQYFDIVPVTPIEVKYFLEADLVIRELGKLGHARRRVSSDWPTGGTYQVSWKHGTFHVEEGH